MPLLGRVLIPRKVLTGEVPTINRVREIISVDTYQRFLDTNFPYADLGFVTRQGTYRLLGEEELDKQKTY